MLDSLKLVFFVIGTMAFFVNVFLAIQHPELVDTVGESEQEVSDLRLRKWDKAMSWLMWGGWGSTALVYYLDKIGYLDMFDS